MRGIRELFGVSMVATCLAAPTWTLAQEEGARPAPPQAPGAPGGGGPPQAGPGGPGGPMGAMFNDPAMRLRMLKAEISGRGFGGGMPGMGGRGGRGGGGNQGGSTAGQRRSSTEAMIGLLLRSEPLQEELKLTEGQKSALKEVSANSNEKRRDLFRNMRGGNNGGGRGGRGGFDPQQMARVQQQMAQMQQEDALAVGQILTKGQIARLNQIRLRILGPMGVAEQDVAEALTLSEEQFVQVNEILAAMDRETASLRQQAMQQFMGNRQGGPGGPPGAPGGGQAAPGGAAPGGRGQGQPGAAPGGRGQANTGPVDDADVDPAAARQARMQEFLNSDAFKEMQKRTQEMTAKQEAIEKQAEAAIGKTLTPAQKKKFNGMLGPEFDLTKLASGGGGPWGGRDRQQGQDRDGQQPGQPTPGGRPAASATAAAPGDAATEEVAPAEDSEAPKAKAAARPRYTPRVRGGSGGSN
jgi:hypothetical protein